MGNWSDALTLEKDNSHMPNHTPFDTLVTLRQDYPTPMTPAQIGELLNAVAWAHRESGYGLLRKPGGANCPQPHTNMPVSHDILVLTDGRIFDCLIDAEGDARPTWGSKKPVNASLWVAPVDPDIAVPPHPPLPPEPPPPVGVPYPGDQIGVEIGNVLFADYAQAGLGPNSGMGVWFFRTAWDVANPPHLSVAESLHKHRNEWRAILGLPPI